MTREEIAEVFERCLSRAGYQRTTIDDVAGALRISKKTVYVHFESKHAIYRHLVSRAAAESRRKMALSLRELHTATEKVRAHLKLLIATARAHILETAPGDWHAEFEVGKDGFVEAHGSLLEELIDEGCRAGAFSVRDARLARRMLTAMLVEYSVMMRENPALNRDAELTEGILRYLK